MKKQILSLALALVLTVPAQAALPTYTDVSSDAWYASAVAYCGERGWMAGTGGGQFTPDAPLTMGMAVTVLYRQVGHTALASEGEAWYAAPAAWAAREGMIEGTFDPDAPAPREAVALLLWRNAGSPEPEAGQVFADAGEITPEALEAAAWVRGEGLMAGYPDGTFRPKQAVTRAQMALILTRMEERGKLADAMDVMCGASGAAAMPDGSLLVTDVYNRVIWHVTEGESTVYAGRETPGDIYGQPEGGDTDGTLEEAAFRTPWAIAAYRDSWAVTDADNGAVRYLSASGVETLRLNVKLDYPTGLTSGGGGELYISDTYKGIIYKVTSEGSASVYAKGLEDPMGLCWSGGTLYAAETGRHRIVKLASGGEIEAVAGSGTDGNMDGPALQAQFSCPQGVTAGADGAIYIADTANSAVRCLRDGQVETIAARDASAGENTFFTPTGLLIQGDTLYVCDSFARKVFAIPLEGWRLG